MNVALPSLFSREVLWLSAAAVAVGLVVAWILRGAPPGQSATAEDDAEAPRSGYRDRMVAGVVTGLLLIAGGGYLALSRGILVSVPVFALGFGLVIFLVVRNHRYRHASPTLRRTIDFSTAVLNAALLAGILIVGNVIAFRYGNHPLDMTREGSYTLSSETTAVLQNLDRPVKFTLFFGQGRNASRQRDRVQQLLEAYKAANPEWIQLDSLNPYNDVTRFEELAKRVPELELLQGGGVVIEYGTGEGAPHAVVRNQDLFLLLRLDPAHQTSDRYTTAFSGEDEITTALMRMKEGRQTKVAFTVGHGEPSTADLNPRGRGIGNWKARLNKIGCEVIELNLLSDQVPQDLALLIVVGPKTPFKPDEVQKLRSFTDRGKPVLLLLGNSEPTGLDDFLKSFNLSLGKGMIIDSRVNPRDPRMVYAPVQPGLKHAIVQAMGPNRYVLLPGAAPIEVAGAGNPGAPGGAPVDPTLVPVAILNTSNSSWAEHEPGRPPYSFDKNAEKSGPLSVGIAVADRAQGARRAAHRKDSRVWCSSRARPWQRISFRNTIERTWIC